MSTTSPSTIAITTAEASAIAAVVLAHLQDAWNHADGRAWGECFAGANDFVDIRGEHHAGDAESIGRAHQGIFDTIYRGSTVRYQLESARPIAEGVIVAVASGVMDAPSGPLAGRNQARFTMVLTTAAGRWEIASFHNTLVPPAA